MKSWNSALHEGYPSDEDVSLNLAVSYVENDLESKTRTLATSVFVKNPSYLWAKKLKLELE